MVRLSYIDHVSNKLTNETKQNKEKNALRKNSSNWQAVQMGKPPSVLLVLRRLRQMNPKFEASLSYMLSPWQALLHK